MFKNILFSLVNILILTFGLGTPAFAQNEVSLGTSQDQIKKYFATLAYSPLDLIIPNKIGFSLGLQLAPKQTHEIEYLNGSLAMPSFIADIGKISDTRVSYIRRFQELEAFSHLFWGFSYFQSQVHLGDALIHRLSAGSYPSIDLMEIQSVGLHVGLGSRWKIKDNIILGVDWFAWSQPVIEIKRSAEFLSYAGDQNDKDNVEKALKLLQYLPRWTVLKLQLGISF